ncbi:hypothetical protein GCM10009566_43750 [Streptomyces murinus]|uniref:Uncharacterized protein n=1 Tax=Streptomyces murinus TaxID=33900 RepID=A0A7W3NI50_STRMR|nr:hypothetical protein [Streptomyces murinus]MBA9050975.1 hypothetical protein [Streptomyces murinus]
MTETKRHPTIKVMADYECHPLWLTGVDAGDIEPGDSRLNLSPQLAQRFTTWAEQFDQTLNHDDPISSGFLTRQAEEEFVATGESLASDLARELGSGWRVLYQDIRSDTTREVRHG